MALPNKKLMALGITLSALGVVMGLLIPLVIQQVIDGSGSRPAWVMGVSAAGIFILEIALSATSYYLLTWIGLKMVKDLRQRPRTSDCEKNLDKIIARSLPTGYNILLSETKTKREKRM